MESGNICKSWKMPKTIVDEKLTFFFFIDFILTNCTDFFTTKTNLIYINIIRIETIGWKIIYIKKGNIQ